MIPELHATILPQWSNSIFQQIAVETIAVLVLFAIALFPFRNRNANTLGTWSSLQSWLFSAPVAFALIGGGGNWLIYGMALLGILGVKDFFQITGMYHRSSFVWLTYIAILLLAHFAHVQK